MSRTMPPVRIKPRANDFEPSPVLSTNDKKEIKITELIYFDSKLQFFPINFK